MWGSRRRLLVPCLTCAPDPVGSTGEGAAFVHFPLSGALCVTLEQLGNSPRPAPPHFTFQLPTSPRLETCGD